MNMGWLQLNSVGPGYWDLWGQFAAIDAASAVFAVLDRYVVERAAAPGFDEALATQAVIAAFNRDEFPDCTSQPEIPEQCSDTGNSSWAASVLTPHDLMPNGQSNSLIQHWSTMEMLIGLVPPLEDADKRYAYFEALFRGLEDDSRGLAAKALGRKDLSSLLTDDFVNACDPPAVFSIALRLVATQTLHCHAADRLFSARRLLDVISV